MIIIQLTMRRMNIFLEKVQSPQNEKINRIHYITDNKKCTWFMYVLFILNIILFILLYIIYLFNYIESSLTEKCLNWVETKIFYFLLIIKNNDKT